ncbi:response regulator with CheY-like receiver, AAA-type ATPase, and DNA-binding domains [Microvirga lotononidis]|uniref:Response regulator with CheY-like receiver, AAA-type ATPase, and DNA-binding domains n=1 Tax=Microvirga lotononidis TaxID=864069 RepID=I4YUT9_9HYPH|nr:response regulator with CheY-like receiver, AAA-type ATPase, and DNA-binding domains [Microvirga lotononidis]
MLGTSDSLEQQGSPQANAAATTPETEQAIDVLRRILVGRTIADVERHLILDTLASCFGNRTHAARILGISIRTLRNKLNEYMEAGIAVPEPGQRPTVAA